MKDYGALTRIEVGTDGCTISVTGKRKGKDVRSVTRNGKFLSVQGGLPDEPVLVITKQNYKPLVVEGKENIVALGKTPKLTSEPMVIAAGLKELKVEMDIYEDCQADLTLHDIMGNLRSTHHCMIDESIHAMNLSVLEPGIYLLTVWVNGQACTSYKIIR